MAGALAVLAQNAHGQILYNDTTTSLTKNFNFDNAEAGNQIILAGGSGPSTTYNITDFTFGYDFDGPNTTSTTGVTADVKFYANDSATKVAGYSAPGTVLFDSGPFKLGGYTGPVGSDAGSPGNFNLAQLTAGNLVNLTGPVPQDFTWTITFAGLGAGQSAGELEYAPPTTGTNFADAWVNTGSGWTLQTASTPPGGSLQFYAEVQGTVASSGVPDASCLPVSALAVAAGLGCMKRFGRKA